MKNKLENALFALEEISTHLNPILTALKVAKRNSKELALDTEELIANVSYWEHEIQAHKKNSELIRKALENV